MFPQIGISHKKKKMIVFEDFGNKKTILQVLKDARVELIAGLRSVEHEFGWFDPTQESAQSLWTCVEVCKSLVEAGEPIYNLSGILNRLEVEAVRNSDNIGWASESLPGHISVYLTSDIGLLFQSIGQKGKLIEILSTFSKIQNSDGGWGVCDGDEISKTRATSFVIRLYSKCFDSPWAFGLVNRDSFVGGIEWLTKAQNDEDGGWGNMADLLPSDISATSIVLNAVLSTKIALRKHPNVRLPIKDSMILMGVKRLIHFAPDGRWRGAAEEFGIKSSTEYPGVFRHMASGMGTLVVLQALCKAARLGYLDEKQEYIGLGLQDIISRCDNYVGHKGKWIVRSDQSGTPTAWNSAFALDAFLEFQRLYLEFHAEGIVDVGLFSRIIQREKLWKRITSVLAIILFLVVALPRVAAMSIYIDWFNEQSAWAQGITMAFISIIFERIFALIGSMYKKYTNQIGRLARE